MRLLLLFCCRLFIHSFSIIRCFNRKNSNSNNAIPPDTHVHRMCKKFIVIFSFFFYLTLVIVCYYQCRAQFSHPFHKLSYVLYVCRMVLTCTDSLLSIRLTPCSLLLHHHLPPLLPSTSRFYNPQYCGMYAITKFCYSLSYFFLLYCQAFPLSLIEKYVCNAAFFSIAVQKRCVCVAVSRFYMRHSHLFLGSRTPSRQHLPQIGRIVSTELIIDIFHMYFYMPSVRTFMEPTDTHVYTFHSRAFQKPQSKLKVI